jgi:hypothetical protein
VHQVLAYRIQHGSNLVLKYSKGITGAHRHPKHKERDKFMPARQYRMPASHGAKYGT